MDTLGDAIAETRALLGDPDGDWVVREYILPLINSAYNLQRIAIKTATRRNLEQVVEIPNVAKGTTTLGPLQKPGLALNGLAEPLEVWGRVSGSAGGFHRGVERYVLLANRPLGLGGLAWQWMSNQLTIAPANVSLDLVVCGVFNPPPLTEDTQPLILHPDIKTPLALAASAMAGVERTRPELLEGYAQQAQAAVSDICADLIRQKQGVPQRVARIQRRGWFWW